MADSQPEKSKRQMVARLKQTVLGKMPLTVILFAAACVEGGFELRMNAALDYIRQVIKTGNETSKTLFGITAEIIRDEGGNVLFGGRPPDMEQMGEILHQGLVSLTGAIEAGVFARQDIVELMEHLYRLAHTVMLPESNTPDEHERVQISLAAMDKLKASVTHTTDQNSGRKSQVAFHTLTSRVDSALNNAASSLQSGMDPIIPFAMVWDASNERTIQRSISDDYDNAVAMARAYVKSRSAELSAYVIAWSGYVAKEGTRYDAVLVEAAELVSEKAAVMAMRYMPTTETTNYKEMGNVMMLAYRDNLIKPKSKK